MPGHIYLQGFSPVMYYTHNLHFLLFARAAQGRFTDAKKAADEIAVNIAPVVVEMPMA